MRDVKVLDSAMKTLGWIEEQMVKCGKPNCKCVKGDLHGPYYYYRYRKLHHRVWIPQKKYLNKKLAERLQKAMRQYQQLLTYFGENQYQVIRRGIKQNIKKGVTGMTQRKLMKVSALTRDFT